MCLSLKSNFDFWTFCNIYNCRKANSRILFDQIILLLFCHNKAENHLKIEFTDECHKLCVENCGYYKGNDPVWSLRCWPAPFLLRIRSGSRQWRFFLASWQNSSLHIVPWLHFTVALHISALDERRARQEEAVFAWALSVLFVCVKHAWFPGSVAVKRALKSHRLRELREAESFRMSPLTPHTQTQPEDRASWLHTEDESWCFVACLFSYVFIISLMVSREWVDNWSVSICSKHLPLQKNWLNLVSELILFGGQSQKYGQLEKDKLIELITPSSHFREPTITTSTLQCVDLQPFPFLLKRCQCVDVFVFALLFKCLGFLRIILF